MNVDNQPNSRSALRRLLIVLAVVGIVVYAYGWRVTDMAWRKPDPRQASVSGNAQLLSPNLFEQDTTLEEASGFRRMLGAAVEQPPHDDGNPTSSLRRNGTRDDVVTVEGSGYPANSIARLHPSQR
jgi:hypothetical protein